MMDRKRINVLAAAMVGMFGSGALAAPTVALTPPAQVSNAEGEVRFDLLVTNDGAAPEPYRAADGLSCRLTTPDGVADVEARRLPSEAEFTIAPGGFVRIAYSAALKTAGRVIVELSPARQ
jgi:hypothetical protein